MQSFFARPALPSDPLARRRGRPGQRRQRLGAGGRDCVHLSLSWRPGETATRAQMEEVAESAMQAIGIGNAKAIFAAHNDEDHVHMHIVASKFNPETGLAYDLKRGQIRLFAMGRAVRTRARRHCVHPPG